MIDPLEDLAKIADHLGVIANAVADYDTARQKLFNNEGDVDAVWGTLTAADALRRAVAP